MKKLLFPLLCAASLMMAGCRAADPEPVTLNPSSSPTTSTAPATTRPMTSSAPMVSPGAGAAIGSAAANEAMTAAGVTSAAQAKRISEEAEDALERLSEVSDAQVVVIGSKAAVALDFDSQYQGGVDERLKDMVRERIDGLVKGVKDVIILTDNAAYEKLEMLGDKLEGSAALDELARELEDIITATKA